MAAAWFVDGEYMRKIWMGMHRTDRLDYLKLRKLLTLPDCRY